MQISDDELPDSQTDRKTCINKSTKFLMICFQSIKNVRKNPHGFDLNNDKQILRLNFVIKKNRKEK